MENNMTVEIQNIRDEIHFTNFFYSGNVTIKYENKDDIVFASDQIEMPQIHFDEIEVDKHSYVAGHVRIPTSTVDMTEALALHISQNRQRGWTRFDMSMFLLDENDTLHSEYALFDVVVKGFGKIGKGKVRMYYEAREIRILK